MLVNWAGGNLTLVTEAEASITKREQEKKDDRLFEGLVQDRNNSSALAMELSTVLH